MVEDLHSINRTTKQIFSFMNMVDVEEDRIKRERDKLEDETNRERENLFKEIDGFMRDLETLKDFGMRQNYAEMN